MGVIRELVCNLAILLILATLMEMLLPMGNLRNFVKMIMGLFLIVTIMNPILQVVNQPIAFQVTDSALRAETQGILEKGKQIQQVNEQAALRQYEQTLAQQIKAVAKLAPNVSVQDVRVAIDGASETGQIKQISLRVTPTNRSETAKSLVDPVDIAAPQIQGAGGAGRVKATTAEIGQISPEDKQNLIETIANFYNIPAAKVILQIEP